MILFLKFNSKHWMCWILSPRRQCFLFNCALPVFIWKPKANSRIDPNSVSSFEPISKWKYFQIVSEFICQINNLENAAIQTHELTIDCLIVNFIFIFIILNQIIL